MLVDLAMRGHQSSKSDGVDLPMTSDALHKGIDFIELVVVRHSSVDAKQNT